MMRFFVRVVLLLLVVGTVTLFSAHPAFGEPDPNASFMATRASIVLVEGDERTTGFVVARDQQFGYIVTAAHVIDHARWADNEHVPATSGGAANFRLSPTDFISVHLPISGIIVSGEVLGEPDFEHDFLIVRIPIGGQIVKPACLAAKFVPNVPVGLASFGIGLLYGAIPSTPFDQYIANQTGNGLVLVPASSVPDQFEFNVPSNPGFSGGPLYALSSGLVLGIVRQSGTVITNAPQTPTTLGEIVDYVRTTIAKSLGTTEVPAIKMDTLDASRVPPPDLRGAGYVRIIQFDDAATGTGAVPTPAVYANQEGTIQTVLTAAFGQPTLPVHLVPGRGELRSYKIGTKLEAVAENMCMVNEHPTAAAVAIRRSLVKGQKPKTRTLQQRLALLDCAANVIDWVDVATVTVGGDGSLTDSQAKNLATALRAALATLAGPNHRRLLNFAIDGLPLDDGEYRGFFAVRNFAKHAYIGPGWLTSVFADHAHIQSEIDVVNVDGRSAELPISSLKSSELDTFLNAAGPSGVAVNTASGIVHLFGADRCFLLERRQEASDDGSFQHVRKGDDTL